MNAEALLLEIFMVGILILIIAVVIYASIRDARDKEIDEIYYRTKCEDGREEELNELRNENRILKNIIKGNE